MHLPRRSALQQAFIGIVLGLLATTACRQLLGVEDHPRPPGVGSAGGAGGSAGTGGAGGRECTVEPFDSCDACRAASCADERAACDAVPECGAFLACEDACGPDFYCYGRCLAAHAGADAGAGADGGSATAVDLGLAFGTCTETRCPNACRLGRNWSCLGQVAWPTELKTSVTVSLTIRSGVPGLPPPESVTVRACFRALEDCEPPAAVGTTESGQVALTIPVAPPHWEGYLEALPTADGPGHIWITPGPFYDDVPSMTVAYWPHAYVDALSILVGVERRPGTAWYWLNLGDCQYHGSPELDVELDPPPTGSSKFFADRSLQAWRSTPDSCAYNGTVGFIDLAAGTGTVRVRRAADGREVAERWYITRPDTITIQTVLPTPL